MEIPWQSLKRETLVAVVEEFITREGTHYGHDDEAPLDVQVARVLAQLERDEAFVSYDDESETVTIVARHG